MRPRILCPNCGSDVEHLAFCGVCGQPLPATTPSRESRLSSPLNWLRRLRHIPAHRIILLVGALLMLLALLGDQPSLAIAVAVIVVPLLTVSYLTEIDIYEREPWTIIVGTFAGGAIVGLLAGWLSTLSFDQLWFDTSPFNLGAGGFAGDAADGQGGPPVSVILINGVLIPVLSAIATLAGPVSLRRSNRFRNEVLDGVTLGAAAGGGFAAAMALVYFWPVFFDDSMPAGSVSEWTASLAGLVVLRPLILAFSAALLGAAIWAYIQTQRTQDLAWPLAAGILGWIGTAICTLLLIPYAPAWELLWTATVLVVVFALFRQVVRHGLALDRRALVGSGEGERVVCPNCHRVTPDGKFCAFCGADLHPEEAAPALAPAAASAPSPPEPTAGTEGADIAEHGPTDSISSPESREAPASRAGQEAGAADTTDDDLAYLEANSLADSSQPRHTPAASTEPELVTPPRSWYDLGREAAPEPSTVSETGALNDGAATPPADVDRRPESEQADAWAAPEPTHEEPPVESLDQPRPASAAADEADAAESSNAPPSPPAAGTRPDR